RVADLGCQCHDTRIAQGAYDIVLRGQPRACDPVRDHLGVTEDWCAGLERRTGSRDEPFGKLELLDCFDEPASMNHAHRDIGFIGTEARQVRLVADDGERTLVDRMAVANIGGAAHACSLFRRSVGLWASDISSARTSQVARTPSSMSSGSASVP